MKMTDLALTKAERKEGYGPCVAMDSDSKDKDLGPRYSYGTRISLGQHELDKLKLSVSDFKVGSELKIEATVKVIELSQNASEKNSSQRVEFQITALSMDTDDDDGPVGAVNRGIREANS